MQDREYISKYRTPIMGVAALWIMIFHGTIDIPIRLVDTFVNIGYLGVDIFMFMSGFSMWNSYCISCECNKKVFINKRLKKILPTFLPFAILWICSYLLSNYRSFMELKAAIQTKLFWITMITFRWFVPCIILCYLITPAIHIFFNKFGYKYQSLLILVAGMGIISIPFVYIKSSVALMVLLRIPEYIIGWYYGGIEKKTKSFYVRVVVVILLYILYYNLLGRFSDEYLCDTGLYWWPSIVCVSSLVLCLTKCKFINNKICSFCGKYSLELYLWHVFFMFSIIEFFEKYNFTLDKYGIFVNVISILFACFVAYCYAKVIDYCMKKITTSFRN